MIRDIIGAWLQMSAGGIFFWLIAFYLLTGVVIHAICFFPKWRSTVLTFNGVVPPFFVAPGIIFSLMISFLAAEVWEHNGQATRVVLDERDAVQAVAELAEMPGLQMAQLHTATETYLKSVLNDEWPRMREQQEAPETSAALDALTRLAMDPVIGQREGPAVQDALISAVQRVATVRSNRLSLSEGRFDRYKWTCVLLLGIVGQLGVAAVHLERRRPQALALLIFTASAVIAVGLIAVSEQPFQGARQISLAPLQHLLQTSMGR
jgi:hypothetical protein